MPPAPDNSPWYEAQVQSFVASQDAVGAAHRAIAARHRGLAAHHAAIAEHHDGLAAAVPEAAQYAADLGTMAQAHEAANVRTVIAGEQELARERDATVAVLAAEVRRLAGVIEALAAQLGVRP